MSRAVTPVALPFPALGINTGRGLANQPEGTCPDARNVRTEGQFEDRARGGQREGLVKAFATDLGDDGPVNLNTVIIPSSEGDALAGLQQISVDVPNNDGTYSVNDKVDDDARFTAASDVGESGGAVQTIDNNKIRVVSTPLYFAESTSSSVSRVDCGVIDNLPGLGTNYEVSMTTQFPSRSSIVGAPGDGMRTDIGFFIRAASDYKSCLELLQTTSSGSGTKWGLSTRINGSSTTVLESDFLDHTTFGISYPITESTWTIAVAGDTMTIYLLAAGMTSRLQIVTGTVSALNTQTGVGFGIEGTASTGENIKRFVVSTQRPAPFGRRTVYVVAQVPDKAYVGTLTENTSGTMTEITSGGGTPLAESGNVSSVSLFNKLYAVNGTAGVVIDPAAQTLADWTATAGTRPDGYLVEAFRGSAVIAADPSDPNNLYMSAVEDPLDWDYGAEPIETSAFALDNSDLGKNSDPIIALATWSDDFMLIGGNSTLRVMSGDPRAGGRLDIITLSLGVLGPRAVCVAPSGELYFVGNDGLYRMPFGSTVPESISRGRLDSVLRDIDLSAFTVACTYNAQAKGIHIWITPIDPTAIGVHVFYSIGDNAFWLDQLPAATMDPTAAIGVFGNSTQIRNVILGCRDGYLRRFDTTAKDDDGSAIVSWVKYAPLLAGGGMTENIVRELQLEMARDASATTWTLRAADSAEDLDDDNAVRTRTGTTTAGKAFQPPVRLSLRYAAMQLEMRNETAGASWAMERAVFRERAGGRRHA